MLKIKHQRTADCVVAGLPLVQGRQGHARRLAAARPLRRRGHAAPRRRRSSFKQAERAELAEKLEPLREGAREVHPWRDWAELQDQETEQRLPGATSRWNRGKDLSWEPIRLGLVAEVSFDHMQGTRFRHATHFKRWRPDKPSTDCRYDQLDETPPVEIAKIFGT